MQLDGFGDYPDSSGEKVIQQSLELQLLNFLKILLNRRGGRRIGLMHCAMAGVHKAKGVPTALGD